MRFAGVAMMAAPSRTTANRTIFFMSMSPFGAGTANLETFYRSDVFSRPVFGARKRHHFRRRDGRQFDPGLQTGVASRPLRHRTPVYRPGSNPVYKSPIGAPYHY